MNKKSLRDILVTGAAAFALAVPAFVQAQTSLAQGEEPEGRVTLSDIVVTARRTEERLQNVPISATAFDAAGLARQNVQTTQDLFGQVPSLVVGGSGQSRSSENITIRGQGATFNAAPGVVMYLAEVPIIADQRNNAQNGGGANFYDLASVQVLRGSQGTLFGRNTTGGAVLFEPQKPTDRLEGYGQVQYGNYDSIELRGAVNIPVIKDKLLLRVAGLYQNRTGFTQELTTGTDLDDRNRFSLRAGLTWRPTDTVENYLMATMTKVDEHGSSTVLNAVPAGSYNGVPYSTFLAEQIARGIRSVKLSPIDWREKSRSWSITDIFSAELSDEVTFRNIANYSRLKHTQPFDADGFPEDSRARYAAGLSEIGINEFDPSSTGRFNYPTNTSQYSVEPQLQGKINNGDLVFVLGAYYEHVKPGEQIVRVGNVNNARFVPNKQFSTSKALYAQGTLSFGSFSDALSRLRLTLGYRYTWDSLRAISNFQLPNTPATTNRAKYAAPNWLIGLDYDVIDNVLLYGKISRGYKTGGIGRVTPAPSLRVFKPEFVKTYEAGIKADWRIGDVPIRTNIDYYYTDFKDIQRTGGTSYIYTDPTTGITAPVFGAQTVNAGRAHIQGVEFEGEIRPTSWFTLSGSYSYTRAKYDEYALPSLFPNGLGFPGFGPGFDCGVGVPFDSASGNCILKDIPFQFTPKNQYSITGRLDLPVDDSIGKISLAATYSYVDAQYTSPSKAPVDEPYAYIGGNCPRNVAGSVVCGPKDGYGLLSLNLQWASVMGSNFDVTAFATNVTNEDYVLSSNGSSYQGGFNSLLYGEPRMYGVSLRYRFGE